MNIIHAAQLGLRPGSSSDIAVEIRRVLAGLACGSRLVFEPGVYYLFPEGCAEVAIACSNTPPRSPKRLAILLQDLHDIEIDFTGVEFRCHGQMTPIALIGCSDISITGGRIDWDQPLSAEAEVLTVNDGQVGLAIDASAYPYRICDDRLEFLAHGWPTACFGVVEFVRRTGEVAPGSGEETLATVGWNRGDWTVTEGNILADGRRHLIISGNFLRLPAAGNRLMLRHGQRDHPGILIAESSAIILQQVVMHHNAGLGILCQFSRDLTFIGCRLEPSRGRCFSGKDDGLQCSNCAGTIRVDGCIFSGLADDPINIHGTVLRIEEILSNRSVRLRLVNAESQGLTVLRVGDEIALLDRRTLADRGTAIVRSVTRWSDSDFDIDLDRALPPGTLVHDAIESRTWTPAALITGCVFDPCRGRGILVSTPKSVVIQRNRFRSAGSAILIAGDANYWYESGSVSDVLIEDNDFAACCNANDYQFGEAVISIHPEIPRPDQRLPYHRGIRILGNRFALSDHALLAAFSVADLEFRRNHIIADHSRPARHAERPLISLRDCPNSIIDANLLDPALRDHRLINQGIESPLVQNVQSDGK